MTEGTRKHDNVLRRKCGENRIRDKSSASDKERAQTTTGAYTDVRDRGVRNRDAVSREKYFPDQDLLRQLILPFVKS